MHSALDGKGHGDDRLLAALQDNDYQRNSMQTYVDHVHFDQVDDINAVRLGKLLQSLHPIELSAGQSALSAHQF